MKRFLSLSILVMLAIPVMAQHLKPIKTLRTSKCLENVKAFLQSNAFQQAQLNKKASTNRTNAYDFNWDVANSKWTTDTSAVYTYSWNTDNTINTVTVTGKTSRTIYKDFKPVDVALETDIYLDNHLVYSVVENQVWDAGQSSWESNNRQNIKINAGRLEEFLEEEYDNGNWEPVSKEIISYDSRGSFTGITDYEWDGSNWDMDYGSRYIYTYDANNHIIAATNEDYDNGIWEEWEAEEYLLNSDGSIHTAFRGEHYNGTFEAYDSMLITWENFQPRPTVDLLIQDVEYITLVGGPDYSTFTSYWNDWPNGWELDGRGTITFNSNGMRILDNREQYDGSAWQGDTKTIWVYYSSGELQKKHELQWNSNDWDTTWTTGITLSKDSDGDLVSREQLTKYFSNGTPVATYGTKTIFEYGTPTGISETAELLVVRVYPNPAASVVYINVPQAQGQVLIDIKDLTGRTVITANGPANNKIPVDISSLVRGNYIVTVRTGNEMFYSKLVRE